MVVKLIVGFKLQGHHDFLMHSIQMRVKIFILLISCCISYISSSQIREHNDSIIRIAARIIKEGDVVFRNGKSKESSLIRSFSTGDSAFSHCGIVLKNSSNQLMVFHMLGGQTTNGSDIHIESFYLFTTDIDNDLVGIYRYGLSENEMIKINAYIQKLVDRKVRFDYEFSYVGDERLYCSEMVAKAIHFGTKGRFSFDLSSMDISKNPVRFWLKANVLKYYSLETLQNKKFVKKFWRFSLK